MLDDLVDGFEPGDVVALNLVGCDEIGFGKARENLGGLYDGALAVILPASAIGVLAIGINLVVDWLGTRSGRDISEGFL